MNWKRERKKSPFLSDPVFIFIIHLIQPRGTLLLILEILSLEAPF